MGLTFEKLLLIGVIAAFVIGPERLPGYAAKFTEFVRRFKSMADGAKTRMREEMGPEFDEVDWKRLDPRRYDPRRIIREALNDDPAAEPTAASTTVATAERESAAVQHRRLIESGGRAPFDDEAT